MLIVIGTTTLDVFMTGLDRLPQAGGDEFTPDSISFTDDPPTMTLGGNGANSCFIASGLGLETQLCSVVADDPAGHMLVEWLTTRDVGLDGLHRDASATSMTIVAADRDRARLSFHHPGSGRAFTPDRIPGELLTPGATVLVSGYHLLLGMRGDPGVSFLARALAAGVKTAVDVGPIVPPPASADEWRGIVPQTDYLIGNEYELLTCTGASTLEAAAESLLALGTGAVVAKRGGAGSALFTSGSRIDAASFPVDVRSTVGAGDSFNAGLFAALAHGSTPAEALRFANAVAALVISSPRGVLDGPNRAVVEELLTQP